MQPQNLIEKSFIPYSFQGQEHDNEVKGEGNSMNYKYRMHDTRLGRFFAIDPLAAKYPYNGPYNFSENRLIDGVELEGLEVYYTSEGQIIGKYGENTEIRLVYDEDVEAAKFIVENQNSNLPSIKEMNDHLYNSGSSPAMRDLDGLATEWGNRNNRNSIETKSEFTSFIYTTRIGGKNYVGYTKPQQGDEASATASITMTSKRRPIAMIHSHGNYLENYLNNAFSNEIEDGDGNISGDIYTYNSLGITGYVSTPNGSLLKYNEFEGTTVISHEMPADTKDPETCEENTTQSPSPVILDSPSPKF